MKPTLRQITTTTEYSFLVRKDIGGNMINNWHYHSEIEILYIQRSVGTWLIGDHIGYYKTGDVVIIGPNLPHCFRHEYDYIMKRDEAAGETICVKFLPEIFGDQFMNLPECKEIKHLLLMSSRGLKLTGKTRDTVAKSFEKITEIPQGKKLIQVLSILEMIAENKEYQPLSSNGFVHAYDCDDKNRIKIIFEYTFNHYDDKITIEKMALLLNMTKESFCRYFKNKTQKTYVQFLMEVRIGHACRLLMEEEKNVTEISYACGYNNISHFNHQFKLITGKKPLQYKRDYLKNETKETVGNR